MSRKPKIGLDYFPLDTVLNDKINLIEAEFGIKGFAIVVKLYQRIYGGYGYYCEWTKEVALLFADKVNVKVNAVSEIVEASFRRGIFDKNLYLQYGILTSRGIQERFLEAVRTRVRVELKRQYLLLSAPKIREILGNSKVLVNIISLNDDRNPQSKVKESKLDYFYYKETDEEEIPFVDDVLLKEVENGD
ncbi:MAG: DUF4373 domain-containing protein [Clostridia bacterium]|nr:DUF4373 domain-containing protein [Clostridia bacterium]